MISIAMIAFNLFHPGSCFNFKKMNSESWKRGPVSPEDSDLGVIETK
jgi:hypothetical protein